MAKRKGTNKSENLQGTDTADVFIGLGGSDELKGRDGNDRFSAGDGADTVFGGAGNDVIYGHSKADLKQSSGFINFDKIADIGNGGVQTALAQGDNGFIYALNKTSGEITRINTENGNKSTFLNIPDDQFSGSDEGGVLGMAFHPNYQNNGRFFVYLTNTDGDIEIHEYDRVAGNPPTAEFEKVVMTIPHPVNDFHNGGSMMFGPDGYLYLGIGDGGDGANAQDKDSLLGKILRINVNADDFPGDDGKNYAIPNDNPFVGAAGADEIWAVGVRNPWRFSFDSQTGDFYIADVGQDNREEINFVKAGTAGGLNFGWDYREGDLPYGNDDPPGGLDFTDPVFTYNHDQIYASVTGGVVLHKASQGLDGAYVFSDFMTGKFYSLRMVNGKIEDATERTDQIRGGSAGYMTAYGKDSDGHVIAINLGGEVFRLKFGAAAGDGGDTLHGGTGQDKLYGGVGRDKLFGDAGRDRLDGGIGNDVLSGGADADRFIFQTGHGHDRITDFDAEGRGHDVIDLRGSEAITDFEDLKSNHMEQQGQNVLISAGDDEILIEKVQLSELGRSDFDF